MSANKRVRRLLVSSVLVTIVSFLSIPSFAMQRGGGGHNSNDSVQNIQNAIIAAQLLVALAQSAPHLLQQALQAVPNLLPQLAQVGTGEPQAEVLPTTPVRQRQDARTLIKTPEGCTRVPCSRPERPLNFFISPNSKGGRNVIYAQLPERIDFTPKIKLGGQSIPREEFIQRLRNHDRYNDLMKAKREDWNRYGGKAVSEKADYTSYTRFCAEGRNAKNGGTSRHDRSIRDHLNIHQNIFEDIDPDQALELERWLIEELDSNWGRGVNSNGGGHKRKKSSTPEDSEEELFGSDWLDDDCRGDNLKRRRFDESDEDDDSSGTDSYSSQGFSSPLNSLQAVGSEVY